MAIKICKIVRPVGIQSIFFLLHPHRYNREEVVRSLGKEVNLNPPLTLGQLPDTPEELLKLDQVRHYLDIHRSTKG